MYNKMCLKKTIYLVTAVVIYIENICFRRSAHSSAVYDDFFLFYDKFFSTSELRQTSVYGRTIDSAFVFLSAGAPYV